MHGNRTASRYRFAANDRDCFVKFEYKCGRVIVRRVGDTEVSGIAVTPFWPVKPFIIVDGKSKRLQFLWVAKDPQCDLVFDLDWEIKFEDKERDQHWCYRVRTVSGGDSEYLKKYHGE